MQKPTDLVIDKYDDWRNYSACSQSDPELFFPSIGTSKKSIAKARSICLTKCDVLKKCREFALSHYEPFGMFGGLTPDERKEIRRNA